MKILFMGHQKWACLTLEALLEAGHELVGVVCEKDVFDSKETDHYKRMDAHGFYESLKELALRKNLNVLQPEDVNNQEFLEELNTLKPELIVVVSYHSILKKPLIEKYTIINAHGAPLPYYRGRAPINWAIINGEMETGVTVHYIDEGIDTGKIIIQEKVPILETDTTIDVLLRTLPHYPTLVVEAVKQIETGTVQAQTQSTEEGSYFPKRTPEDGVIDWQKTTEEIYNWIRALTHPYPGAFTTYKNAKLYIWKASKSTKPAESEPGMIEKKEENGVIVSTGDTSIRLDRVQLENGVEKDASEVLAEGEKLE